MPIIFDQNAMLDPTQAHALEKAITEGIGDTQGEFHCSVYRPLGPVLYVITLRTSYGKVRLEIPGHEQVRLDSLREAVRGAMPLLGPKTMAAGS